MSTFLEYLSYFSNLTSPWAFLQHCFYAAVYKLICSLQSSVVSSNLYIITYFLENKQPLELLISPNSYVLLDPSSLVNDIYVYNLVTISRTGEDDNILLLKEVWFACHESPMSCQEPDKYLIFFLYIYIYIYIYVLVYNI